MPLLFEVEVPEITVRESDDESWTKQSQRGADVPAPIGLDAINGDGGIEREGETEGLEEQSKRHLRAPFEKASESERNEVGEDKRDGGRGSALRANEGLDHEHPILPTNRQWNKREDYFGNVLIRGRVSNAPHRLETSDRAEDRRLSDL